MGKTIAVITGSRADFGHLAPVMRGLAAVPDVKLQVVACGQHLEPRFGETWREVADAGFPLAAKVDFGLTDDSALAVAQATGRGLMEMSKALATLKPDLAVVLGDRYEIYAAATAAFLLDIPVAHIYGGEVTEGAFDDALRHAISKLASLHFVAAEPYAARLRRMGEQPGAIHVVGVSSLDQLNGFTLLDRPALMTELGLNPAQRLFLVTYHPVTRAPDLGLAGAKALVAALAKYPDAAVIYTGVNSDPGHDAISQVLTADLKPGRRVMVTSLGQRRYLSALKAADAVIGNSSSGLDEAPAFEVPTVNIGDRQRGRLRAISVIDSGESAADIETAINRALDPAFRAAATKAEPPYGRGGAAAKIVAVLRAVDPASLSRKPFHDIIAP